MACQKRAGAPGGQGAARACVLGLPVATLLAALAPQQVALGATPAQKCEAGKNKVVGKHSSCLGSAAAKLVTVGDPGKDSLALGKRTTKFSTSWEKLDLAAIAASAVCPGSAPPIQLQVDDLFGRVGPLLAGTRIVDNGDGTATDSLTGLQWELKTPANGEENYADPHAARNTYSWSASGSAPDGSVFTSFLTRLNRTRSLATCAAVCIAATGRVLLVALSLGLLLTSSASFAATTPVQKCIGKKLKVVAKFEKAILGCYAKSQASGDTSGFNDCFTKSDAKFRAAFDKITGCNATADECSPIATGCFGQVAAALPDVGPSTSECEGAKTKAAAKRAMDQLKCYAKATVKNVAVDGACLTKAVEKFTAAFAKAGGSCTGDGGVVASLVDAACVAQVAGTDPVPSGVCGTIGSATTTTTTLPSESDAVCCENFGICVAGYTMADCLSAGGTAFPGSVCDASRHCVAPPGAPASCCEYNSSGPQLCSAGLVPSDCSSVFGTYYPNSHVCAADGTCQLNTTAGTCGLSSFPTCGGTCPSGQVCQGVNQVIQSPFNPSYHCATAGCECVPEDRQCNTAVLSAVATCEGGAFFGYAPGACAEGRVCLMASEGSAPFTPGPFIQTCCHLAGEACGVGSCCQYGDWCPTDGVCH